MLHLFWCKEIKNMLHYQDFTAVFVKMYKIREHGGFSQSRSHITMHHSKFNKRPDIKRKLIFIKIISNVIACMATC